MTEIDLLQFSNHLSLLTFAVSLLPILGLRIVSVLLSQQIELIQEFRTSLVQTSRNCLRARSAALAREFEAHDSDDMRVSHLRRRLKELKSVENASVHLLSALETGRK